MVCGGHGVYRDHCTRTLRSITGLLGFYERRASFYQVFFFFFFLNGSIQYIQYTLYTVVYIYRVI